VRSSEPTSGAGTAAGAARPGAVPPAGPAVVPPPGHLAIGGVVRLLCEVRLAILVVAFVSSVVQATITPLGVLMVAVAAPFSYVPARTWERRGDLLSRSGILLACDLVTTVIVLLALQGELMMVYAAATVSLLGVVVGMRLALVMAIPVALTLLAENRAMAAGDLRWLVLCAGAVGVVGMAWAGGALGTALRAQAAVANELAASQARRAATLERVRIARDLHDTVAGDLAGATLLGQTLVRRLERDEADAEAQDLARALLTVCRTAHADTRTALGELRRAETAAPDDLAEVCERWADRTGIACTAELDPSITQLAADLASDVKAVVLELLENVRRHSGAASVTVRVAVVQDEVHVEVTDDGRGLDDDKVDAVGTDGHFGIVGIRERARSRGGHVHHRHPAGGGLSTLVTFGVRTRSAVPS